MKKYLLIALLAIITGCNKPRQIRFVNTTKSTIITGVMYNNECVWVNSRPVDIAKDSLIKDSISAQNVIKNINTVTQ